MYWQTDKKKSAVENMFLIRKPGIHTCKQHTVSIIKHQDSYNIRVVRIWCGEGSVYLTF